ncbi:hypothetical protein BN874_40004 [Candidatus Contendobacter odensis Run_B_J11]|uniref:Uncharacterized protein n=1 Tax=Candidatus Contendobacter odensis Run_B_J11 TaxID=1400861 RepID=A0A7U7GD52_9GAMM|nr:hypothetical protein BN874_40004 [Candidatus Contendobacter odensis Run_B_J11]
MRRLERFARYWDLIGNSGRFRQTRLLFLGDDPFGRFMALSDWLFAVTGQTHQFALERLFDLLYRGLTEALGVTEAAAQDALTQDHQASGAKSSPAFLQRARSVSDRSRAPKATSLTRQARHR